MRTRASTAPTAPDSAALLNRLNQLIQDDLPGDRFITLVVAVLDQNGTVQLTSAGHGPTLLFAHESGEVSEFHGDGLPLGVIPNEEYGPTTSLTLAPGDVLVMLTDGFFEIVRARQRGAIWHRAATRVSPCSGIGRRGGNLASVDESVRKFCDGSPQQDDMTAIVIKRTA